MVFVMPIPIWFNKAGRSGSRVVHIPMCLHLSLVFLDEQLPSVYAHFFQQALFWHSVGWILLERVFLTVVESMYVSVTKRKFSSFLKPISVLGWRALRTGSILMFSCFLLLEYHRPGP